MTTRTARVVLGVALALTAIVVIVVRASEFHKTASTIDFYHYWAVDEVTKLEGLSGVDFYASQDLVAETLAGLARSSHDARFIRAESQREEVQLTGTPAQYWVFAPLPSSYERAFSIFAVALVCSLVAATILLSMAHGYPAPAGLAVAAVIVVGYAPFRWDLDVGNLNCMLLLALTLIAAGSRRVAGAWTVPALTVLVLFKPTMIPICAILALCWFRRAGRSATPGALFWSAVAALPMIVGPLLHFGSTTLWLGWVRYLRTNQHDTILFPTAWGNRSLVVLITEWLGWSATAATVSTVSALTLLLLLGVVLRKEATFRNRVDGALRDIVVDPFLGLALGALLTATISAVFWPHYYMLTLWAALILVLRHRRRRTAWAIAGVSIIFSSGLLASTLGTYALVLSWIPLVPLVTVDAPSQP